MSDYPQGIRYPFSFSTQGSVRVTNGIDKIQSNFSSIAKTAVNERLVRKNVGTIGYTRVLRNNNSDATRSAIQKLVKDALSKHEPRAFVLDVQVYSEDLNSGRGTFIKIKYLYKATGQDSDLELKVQ